MGQRSLRRYLEEHGLTQAALAKRLHCHHAHLSRIVSGQRRPGLALALRIVRVTGIPIEALLEQGGKR